MASSIAVRWLLLVLSLYSTISTDASLAGGLSDGDFQHGGAGETIRIGHRSQEMPCLFRKTQAC
jgi:hypothetical protein